jgi:hypothetical protein
VAEINGLLNRRTVLKPYRGFESLPHRRITYQKVSETFKSLTLKVFYFGALSKRNSIYQNVGALFGASKFMKKLTHQT